MKNPSASHHDAFLADFIQRRFFLFTDLEENLGQFTNAKRNLRDCALRRNSSPCQIGKNAKMLSAKSTCRTACSILKSFSSMMRTSTTKWSASSWNCEFDEPPSLFIVHPSTFYSLQNRRRRVVWSRPRRQIHSDWKSLCNLYASNLRSHELHSRTQYHSSGPESKPIKGLSLSCVMFNGRWRDAKPFRGRFIDEKIRSDD